MKRIQLLIYILIATNPIYSTEYFPLVDTTSEWYVAFMWGTCAEPGGIKMSHYTFRGDTLVDTIHYKKLYDFDEYVGGLREDTNRKVFFLPNSHYYLEMSCLSYTDTAEVLLYDFNLEIEDTLNINNYCFSSHIVDIDSVSINGIYRKRFLTNRIDQIDDYWIEGIGSLTSLFYPLQSCNECGWVLTCSFSNYEKIYSNPGSSECMIYSLSEKENADIEVFPNPFSGELHITMLNNYLKKNVYVYSIQGTLLYSESFSGSEFIMDTPFERGMYIIEIVADNKRMYYKVVKN